MFTAIAIFIFVVYYKQFSYMPLKNITITIKNLDEEAVERVNEFIIKKMKESGLKAEVKETNVRNSSK